MLGLRRRPQLLSNPTLFEIITKKNIQDISAFQDQGQSQSLPDLLEDIDEPAPTSVVFSHPVNYLHSTTKTIRMAPPNSSNADGEKQNGSIFSISGPVIVAENMIGCAMYELVRNLSTFPGYHIMLIMGLSVK